MTLQEAIEKLKVMFERQACPILDAEDVHFASYEQSAFIATILNAVVDGSLALSVKGELKTLPVNCKHCGTRSRERVRFDECFDCSFSRKRTEQEG